MSDEDRGGWIPFGERPAQILHPDTAAEVLRLFCERHRAMFGALLAEALTGEPPRIGRKR